MKREADEAQRRQVNEWQKKISHLQDGDREE